MPTTAPCANRSGAKFVNRGDNGDANDTNAVIAEIVRLRDQRAKLLGFRNHAEWRMQDTMAKTPAAAMSLMNRVWAPAKARVAEEGGRHARHRRSRHRAVGLSLQVLN